MSCSKIWAAGELADLLAILARRDAQRASELPRKIVAIGEANFKGHVGYLTVGGSQQSTGLTYTHLNQILDRGRPHGAFKRTNKIPARHSGNLDQLVQNDWLSKVALDMRDRLCNSQ